jgi:type IV fimbrial biogenesis protein FimT
MNRRSHGFTLVELMVALAIVGVATAVALPSFQSMVRDTRLTSQANDMLSALKFTRSEAVKRNARVTMCKSDNGTACSVTDSATGNWQGGWIVFADGGAVGVIDATDTILQVHGALASSTLIGDGSVNNFVSYAGSGQTSAAGGGTQVGTFSLCSPVATAPRRKLSVTQGSGWVGVTTAAPAASCSAA